MRRIQAEDRRHAVGGDGALYVDIVATHGASTNAFGRLLTYAYVRYRPIADIAEPVFKRSQLPFEVH